MVGLIHMLCTLPTPLPAGARVCEEPARRAQAEGGAAGAAIFRWPLRLVLQGGAAALRQLPCWIGASQPFHNLPSCPHPLPQQTLVDPEAAAKRRIRKQQRKASGKRKALEHVKRLRAAGVIVKNKKAGDRRGGDRRGGGDRSDRR